MAESHTADDGRTDADRDDDFLADVVVRDATRRLTRELSDEHEVSTVEAERFGAHSRKSDYINIQLMDHAAGNSHTLGYIVQKIAATGVARIQSIDADGDLIRVAPSEG